MTLNNCQRMEDNSMWRGKIINPSPNVKQMENSSTQTAILKQVYLSM